MEKQPLEQNCFICKKSQRNKLEQTPHALRETVGLKKVRGYLFVCFYLSSGCLLCFTSNSMEAPCRQTEERHKHVTHILQWHTHTRISAADSRALSPITTEHGCAAWWEQTIWGICQVLVDSKQSIVKNALPWWGSLLFAPLCSVCGVRYDPKSKTKVIIFLSHRSVLCPHRLL